MSNQFSPFFRESAIDAAALELRQTSRRRLRMLWLLLVPIVALAVASVIAAVIIIPTIIQDISVAACLVSTFMFSGAVGGAVMIIPRIRSQRKLMKDCGTSGLPRFYTSDRMRLILRRHRYVMVFLRVILALAVLLSLAITVAWIYLIWANPPKGIMDWLELLFHKIKLMAIWVAAPIIVAGYVYLRWRGRIDLLQFCLDNEFQYLPRLGRPQLASLRELPLMAHAWERNAHATDAAIGTWNGRDVLLINFGFDGSSRQTVVFVAAATAPARRSLEFPIRVQVPSPSFARFLFEGDPFVEMTGEFVAIYWHGVVWPERDAALATRLFMALEFVEAWERSRAARAGPESGGTP